MAGRCTLKTVMDAGSTTDGGSGILRHFFIVEKMPAQMLQEGCEQEGRKGNTNSNHPT